MALDSWRAVASERDQALRISGPVLPDGEVRDLYVVDGRITLEKQAGAETVASGWVVPGLVDAHCHLGLDDDGGTERRGHRAAGGRRPGRRRAADPGRRLGRGHARGSTTGTTCPG